MFEQDLTSEPEAKKPADYTGVAIGVLLSPLLILFIYLGKEDAGRTAFVGLAAIILAIRIRWDLRKHFWFWATITLVLVLHIPLIYVVHWPHGWVPGVAVLPFAVADCSISLGAIQLAEKLLTFGAQE